MYCHGSLAARRRISSSKARRSDQVKGRSRCSATWEGSMPSRAPSNIRASRRAVSMPAAAKMRLPSAKAVPTSIMGVPASAKGHLLGGRRAGHNIDEFVQIAVENFFQPVDGQAHPVVGHPALGEVVGADALA